MALTEEDKKEIAKIVRGAMQGGCVCGLSESSQSEMGHLIGRFRDIGNGNLNKGIEDASEAIKAWIRIKSRGEKIGGAVACSIAVMAAGGLVTLLWIGFKFTMKAFNVETGVDE